MNNLRELTRDAHLRVEQQQFVKVLLSDRINPEFYAVYLWNQYLRYDALERAMQDTEFDGLNIWRSQLILEDFRELWTYQHLPPQLHTTAKYVDYIHESWYNKEKLAAHVYVMHMGDMSGGQVIKKCVPGTGSMYNFENIIETKKNMRALLNNSQAPEANKCFEFAERLFEELIKVDIDHYVPNT